jgi:hypothetical protein
VSEAGHGRLNAHPAQTLSRQKKRARASLARFMPYTRWLEAQQPTPEQKRLWSLAVREMMTLADLTPDEERAVTVVLELSAAIAATETNNAAA